MEPLAGRWPAVTGLLLGTIAAAIGSFVDWVVVTEPHTKLYWSPREPLEVTDCCLVVVAVLAAGIAFAMLAGASRNVVPRLPSLVIAIAGGIAFGCFVRAMTGEQNPVELYVADAHHAQDFFPKVRTSTCGRTS